MRHFMTLALISVAAYSASQRTFVLPHVLERSGTIAGIASNITGGQPLAEPVKGSSPFKPLSIEFYPTDNSKFFDIFVEELAKESKPNDWKATTGRGNGGKEVTWHECFLTGFHCPDIEMGSADAGPFTFELAFMGDTPVVPAPSAVQAKQKKWLTSNFRLKLGDLPCSRVNKIESFTIKQTLADDDRDGTFERYNDMSEFSFEVPWADAAAFMEWFGWARDGKPVPLTFELDILNGTELCIGLRSTLNIRSLGPVSPLDAVLAGQQGPTLRVTAGLSTYPPSRGHVTVLK